MSKHCSTQTIPKRQKHYCRPKKTIHLKTRLACSRPNLPNSDVSLFGPSSDLSFPIEQILHRESRPLATLVGYLHQHPPRLFRGVVNFPFSFFSRPERTLSPRLSSNKPKERLPRGILRRISERISGRVSRRVSGRILGRLSGRVSGRVSGRGPEHLT